MIPIRRGGRSNDEGSIITRERRTIPAGLPPPAIATTGRRGSGTGSGTKKTATFDDEDHGLSTRVRVHWARFKKRLGAGSALSESLIEVTETSIASESAGRRYVTGKDNNEATDDEEVDETVVDNQFWLDATSKSPTLPSEKDAQTPEMSGASGTHGASGLTDGGSVHEPTGLMAVGHKLKWFYYRVERGLASFFFTSFYDPVSEAQYKKETYWQGKALAIWGCGFVLLNWILVCILINKEYMILPDKIFYYMVSPVLAVPLGPIVTYDWPRRFPTFYQLFLTFSIWSWAAYNLILLELCGYYNQKQAVTQCPGKEFVGVFYYTTAFPVIALFALGQNRLMAAIQAILTVPLMAYVIRDRQTWIRNTLNFCIFMIFLVWVHYQKEQAERRLHTMRDRLKVQYRATQQAQVRESKAADSKKRFSSYIFHEVRVPLNTALLALQNMQASGLMKNDDIEVTALEGSLTMMSKVLNDVLDFNRMDSGRFESVSKPYAFHKVIKGMLVPLQLVANARGLHLIIELDEQIDRIAKLMLSKARADAAAKNKNSSEKTYGVGSEGVTITVGGSAITGEGNVEDEVALVVGDEHRLRQIVTNLTSNACKFTPTGGKIWVRTKLILPDEYNPLHPSASEPPPPVTTPKETVDEPSTEGNVPPPSLSVKHLNMHNSPPGTTPTLERIVVRIEVEDTGVGIRRKDMVDNRLFSPYVQTDIGRFQGGKGTGLGLALSKHIIRLSGGRLGVKSKRNQGSMFWVELAVGVGRKVLEKQDLIGKDGLVAQNFELSSETTEAFNAPQTEDATPSTMLSTSDGSPHDSAFSAPPGHSASAMRELMEHSGEIELLPRNKQYIVNGTAIPAAATLPRPPPVILQQPPAVLTPPDSVVEGPPSGVESQASSGTTARPTRVPIPPPQFSFNSVSATSGSLEPTSSQFSLGFSPAVIPSTEESQEPSSTSTPKPPEATGHKKPKPPASIASGDPLLDVLVVDDDAMTRTLMGRMLTRNGCVVETAENGKVALDKVLQAKNPFTFAPNQPGDRPRRVQTPYLQEEEPRYDVVFLDNQMPVMSGVDMVRQLRGLKRKDFVVGVTGNALKEDQMEYLDAGVDAVLTKPAKEASLKNFLRIALERKKAKMRAETHDPQPSPKEPPP
ncbi:carbohydrate-binding module family 1 protein [Tulasnella calospora MUT 4182]|uniref:histidine kinase n=1 Tax=Tulasnella calospora MUT 4182 TaxID=1051891 RepID=A0A0C3QI87_9AGAM|nr:carbohydrate-binding module family 1 protein [Tulasnella calospora MUT 4182]